MGRRVIRARNIRHASSPLQIEQVHGGKISIGRALLRSAVLLVPFELNHFVMFNMAPQTAQPGLAFYVALAFVWLVIGLYLLLVIGSPLGQSLHDRVAGTVVVKSGSEQANV